MGLSEEDLLAIREWAKKHPVIEKIWLFGSRARGEGRTDSDVDLAIEMPIDEWFNWIKDFEESPDLALATEHDVWWYQGGAGLGTLEPAIKRDGILVYEKG